METNLKTLREQTDKLLSDYQFNRKMVKKYKQDLAAATRERELSEQAQSIAQETAKAVQQRVHSRIAAIVSRCLETIFDEPYAFQIRFEQKRGKTEAMLVFLRDGNEISPLKAAGGGVVDVAAFALRIAAILLSRPRLRKLIVLDEPFRFVHVDYQPRIRMLLESLTRELDFQLVMITHVEELKCGHVIELG